MKKSILTVFIFTMFLASCATSAGVSKKGNWSAEDKKKAQAEIAEVDSDLDVFGDKKQDFIDCYLEKIENNYKDFKTADSDLDGCTKHAEQCAKEVMK